MTYSSYLNDKELRAAADRYTEMYGGQFECADTGDVLLYRKNEGDTYISVKADYPVPLFTKRLRQATMHKYTVNLLTLWWMPIDEQDLQDIPGFYTMAVIFNAICESQSDLLLDPYLNSIGGAPAGSEKGGENQCF